jgi:hypothetical protein
MTERSVAVSTFTILDAGRPVEVPASVHEGTVRLSAEAVTAALGWELKPQGLCRGSVCIPLPPGSSLARADGIDLAELAGLFDRPLAADPEARAAYLGVSAPERARRLASLEAPDFTLPDLEGRLHSLSDHRGKKVFLVAYASW